MPPALAPKEQCRQGQVRAANLWVPGCCTYCWYEGLATGAPASSTRVPHPPSLHVALLALKPLHLQQHKVLCICSSQCRTSVGM
jgi:hypothetical protein